MRWMISSTRSATSSSSVSRRLATAEAKTDVPPRQQRISSIGVLSWIYLTRFGYTTPLQTAVAFTAIVVAMDFVVALLIERRFAMSLAARPSLHSLAHCWRRAVVIVPVLLEWPASVVRLSDQPSSAARMFAIFRASLRSIMRTASGTSKRARPTASTAIVTV